MGLSAVVDDEFIGLGLDELKTLLRKTNAELSSTKIELQAHRLLVESMKLHILKLKRLQFGQRSEKRAQQIEQLELWVEELEVVEERTLATLAPEKNVAENRVTTKQPRREFPQHLPRETHIIDRDEQTCPDCGNELKFLGEDVSEMLDLVPVRFKVVRYVRPKHACTGCDIIVQEPAPSRPIDRGMVGPGLLAHIVVGKYADHIPLYRQSEIYAREGVELDRSLLAQWVGRANTLLAPLTDALHAHVFAAEVVHADDTTIPVLAPGLGKTKTGRLWTYVRDERPIVGASAPAVWFAYSADRKGEHPQGHLKNFRGILQADGYSGYTKLYENGTIMEAACWAHARRKFTDLHHANQSPIAAEALDRIAALYIIEKEIFGKSPDERKAIRKERSQPILDALHSWLQQILLTVSQKSAMALAINYSLKRWEALTRYCDDGRISIDNNAAERALRCVALGRKNFLFAGSDGGGESAAGLYSLIGTAKLNGYDPAAFLREVFTRIADHPILQIHELLPWNLQSEVQLTASKVGLRA